MAGSLRVFMIYLSSIYRPIINGKFEEKTAGDGPSLTAMFEDDKHLQGVIQSLRVSTFQKIVFHSRLIWMNKHSCLSF